MGNVIEAEVREFVAAFSTLNTRNMLRLCEVGAITWEQARDVAQLALGAAMAAEAE